MKRLSTVLVVVAIALAGCSGTPRPAGPPKPTTVKKVEPCQLVTHDLVARYGLERLGVDKSATSRSCSWASDELAMVVVIRWDQNSLVDFGQYYPHPVGSGSATIDKVKVVVGRSEVLPACATVVLAETGTIVQTVVRYRSSKGPVRSACTRARAATTDVIHRLRAQHLLRFDPTSTPSATHR